MKDGRFKAISLIAVTAKPSFLHLWVWKLKCRGGRDLVWGAASAGPSTEVGPSLLVNTLSGWKVVLETFALNSSNFQLRFAYD